MKKSAKASERGSQSRTGPSPMGVTGPEMEARRQGRLGTVAILKTRRTPLHIIDLAGHAVAVADDAIRAAAIADPPRTAPACAEGCAWCCHKVVGTTVPEVLRIVTHLQQTLSPEELQAVRQRVTRLHEHRKALPVNARSQAGIPCSLLVDNRCSAYSVRPLTCRGFNSSDARQCELSLDPRNRAVVPAYAPQQRLATLVLDGVRAGLVESGLSGILLELTAALHIALTVPDALDQWRAGKPVFDAARLP
jgi:Fe-S-cluster containining protein